MIIPLTAEQRARIEEHLRHPAPGSRAEAAQKYGVDLTLIIEQLRLSPAERVRKLEQAATQLAKVRGIARGQK
jgi:hypothetical protein